jgi:lipoprotein-anchoring transpeptidase ErfK/SrfK
MLQAKSKLGFVEVHVMRKVLPIAVGLLAFAVAAPAAAFDVEVRVSKSRQTMYVYVDGYLEHEWLVSTGRDGYGTPSGVYHPTGFDANHRSAAYHYAPMPYSIFFHGGYAIHGSYDIDNLGSPASHGCIRLHPGDAAELFDLVRGSEDTSIIISR